MFQQYIDLLYAKSERATEDTRAFIAQRDAAYWKWADWFANGLTQYLAANQMTPADGVDYYLKEGADILERTLAFWRTGCYADTRQADVLRSHYSSEEKMRQDMISLAISQFLWPQHYKLYSFFIESVTARAGAIKTYLDIGPGHGLYLATAVELIQKLDRCVGVDISAFSIEMTRGMLRHLVKPQAAAVTLECRDATEIRDDTTFDFVTAGEVIAHFEDPGAFLKRVAQLVAPTGQLFVSTCANCPDSSHVYVFHNVDEIRELLASSGLVIERECVVPSVGNLSEADHVRRRLSISYAAVVRRA